MAEGVPYRLRVKRILPVPGDSSCPVNYRRGYPALTYQLYAFKISLFVFRPRSDG